MLTSADILTTATPCMSKIGAMGGGDDCADTALKARRLVLIESMLVLEEHKKKFGMRHKSLLPWTNPRKRGMSFSLSNCLFLTRFCQDGPTVKVLDVAAKAAISTIFE